MVVPASELVMSPVYMILLVVLLHHPYSKACLTSYIDTSYIDTGIYILVCGECVVVERRTLMLLCYRSSHFL